MTNGCVAFAVIDAAAEKCIVDTDVVSYLFRSDARAEPFRHHLVGRSLGISFMTIAELEYWTVVRNWGDARRARLVAFIDQFTVVPVDIPLCYAWASVRMQARRNGRPIEVADAWVAASAVRYKMPLLTNNRNDFLGVDDLILLPTESD